MILAKDLLAQFDIEYSGAYSEYRAVVRKVKDAAAAFMEVVSFTDAAGLDSCPDVRDVVDTYSSTLRTYASAVQHAGAVALKQRLAQRMMESVAPLLR